MNMEFITIAHGFLIGMLISIPTGPVGFLCIRQALLFPWRKSFSLALGSISADLIFGFIGIFSLTSISSFYLQEQIPIRFVGGLILLYVGIKTFFNMKVNIIPGLQNSENVEKFTSTFLLTMTNPIQIITLPIVFASVGTHIRPGNYGDASLFMIGLAVGAVAMWAILIAIATALKSKMEHHHYKYISYISGGLISTTGLYVLLSLIFR